jgi:hypothetical protein
LVARLRHVFMWLEFSAFSPATNVIASVSLAAQLAGLLAPAFKYSTSPEVHEYNFLTTVDFPSVFITIFACSMRQQP